MRCGPRRKCSPTKRCTWRRPPWDAERAEAEKLRVELSSAFETQGAELEALGLKLAEVQKEASTAAAAAEQSRMESAQQVVALTDQAHTGG